MYRQQTSSIKNMKKWNTRNKLRRCQNFTKSLAAVLIGRKLSRANNCISFVSRPNCVASDDNTFSFLHVRIDWKLIPHKGPSRSWADNRWTSNLAFPFLGPLFKQRFRESTCFCTNCCISFSTACGPRHFKTPKSGKASASTANKRSAAELIGNCLPKPMFRSLRGVTPWPYKTQVRCAKFCASANASCVWHLQ